MEERIRHQLRRQPIRRHNNANPATVELTQNPIQEDSIGRVVNSELVQDDHRGACPLPREHPRHRTGQTASCTTLTDGGVQILKELMQEPSGDAPTTTPDSTHIGIDEPGLPAAGRPAQVQVLPGSTSYYFRTRTELLEAAVVHLTTISRTHFVSLLAGESTADPAVDPAVVIGTYLHHLTTTRMRDVRARYALATDAAANSRLSAAVADCLFSPDGARRLFRSLGSPDDAMTADALLVWCGGVVARAFFAPTSADTRQPTAAEHTAALRRCLTDLA